MKNPSLKKSALASSLLWALGMSSGPALAEWQWSAVQDLGDAPSVHFSKPQVAVEPKSGQATAAWFDTTQFTAETVQAALYADGVWQPASAISSDQTPDRFSLAPYVALDRKGSATWNKRQSAW